MEEFKNVAIVNLLEDCGKKDYGFALYESERKLLKNMTVGTAMVVVNPRSKDNRILGIVKSVIPVEEFKRGVSAQVVGVVNTDGFNARILEELKHRREINFHKQVIEYQLRKRIDQLTDTDYYERMAKEYIDKDPELAKLVDQLKKLGE